MFYHTARAYSSSLQVYSSGPGLSLANFAKHLGALPHRNLLQQATHHVATTNSHAIPTKRARSPARATHSAVASASEGGGTHIRRMDQLQKSAKKHKVAVPAVASGDVVERFLESIGLSADLAETLRVVGISDNARMKALGRLSDDLLDRLEANLVKSGLDYSACLLVRQGLKERATV